MYSYCMGNRLGIVRQVVGTGSMENNQLISHVSSIYILL